MSCLKGEAIEAPKPLFSQREAFLEEGGDTAKNGLNMIGKARLVSASPFRASVKLDQNDKSNINKESDEDDDDDEF